MIESVNSGDITLAMILRADYHAEGIQFFTPDDFSQQVGYMNRPRGYVIPPHVHNPTDLDFAKIEMDSNMQSALDMLNRAATDKRYSLKEVLVA